MSKVKVLLLSPPFVKYYMRNARCDFVSNSSTQWYPIWLGYCGAFLEKGGFQVKVIDAPAAELSHEQVLQEYLDFKPDLLVIYTGKLSEENDAQTGSDSKPGASSCRRVRENCDAPHSYPAFCRGSGFCRTKGANGD